MADEKPQGYRRRDHDTGSVPATGENSIDDNLKEAQELSGSTTHDLRHEAQEAVRMYNASHAADSREASSGVFLPGMVLRIEIKGSSADPLHVTPAQETIIGRRDPTGTSSPDLDLTAQAGYQLGLSRQHAMLRHHDDQLDVVDLSSRNGTYLNGVRLEAHEPTRLHNGDELQLGKLVLRLYFTDVD